MEKGLGRSKNTQQGAQLEGCGIVLGRGLGSLAWKSDCGCVVKSVKVAQSSLTLCDLMDYSSWDSPSQNTGVLPCPTTGYLPNPGTEHVSLTSPELAGIFFTTEPPGKPCK